MKAKRNLRMLSLAGLFVLAVACMPGVSISLTNTQTPRVITATPLPPTVTPVPKTPTPEPAPSDTPAATAVGVDHVNIYLVAVDDNGASGELIGCGDSLVPVEVKIEPTLGVLRAALNELLALEGEQYYGQSGLYNALSRSHLEIDSLGLENGRAIVRLSGQVVTGGECDIPRIEAQLRATALQFVTVDQVTITINGTLLADVLDLRG